MELWQLDWLREMAGGGVAELWLQPISGVPESRRGGSVAKVGKCRRGRESL